MFSAPATSSAPINLKGFMTFDPSGKLAKGGYVLPQSFDQDFELFVEDIVPSYGGVATEDEFFSIRKASYGYIVDTYDITTWELKSSQGISDSLVPWALSYNPADGKIYGNFYSGEFGIVDYHDQSFTKISDVGSFWWASGITADGKMYAISADNNLYSVDTATGELTLIGDTGTTSSYLVGGVIDPRSGRFFYTTNTNDFAGLYDIDLTTGEATLLTELSGVAQVQALFVDKPLAADGAPAVPTNLAVNVVGNERTGTLSFSTPTKTFDGSEGSGALTYSVSFNGEEIATGETTYGAEVTVPFSVDKSDFYTISITVANSEGTSPTLESKMFIGSDIPVMTSVLLQRTGTTMELSWDPVTDSENNASFDPTKVTYTIVRYPDEKVVAENYTETEFSEELVYDGDLCVYYYTVTAVLDDSSSKPKKSNEIVVGHVSAPYSETFDSSDAANAYTIVDVNGDGSTWSYGNGYMQYNYNIANEADDWLILPPVRLKAGFTYKMTCDAWGHGGQYIEKVEVKWGKSANIEDLVNVLVPPTDILNVAPEEIGDYFTPDADGDYSIGIHCISPADDWNLFIDNINITAGVSDYAPAEISEIKAVPSYNGENSVTITLTAPSKAINGEPLTSLESIVVSRGDVTVHTFENPEPGKIYSCTDNTEANGTYVYTASASNELGVGKAVSVETYVGIPAPTAPGLPVVVLNDNLGNVTLEWEAPEVDTYGNPINPQFITYTVTNAKDSKTVYAEGISETKASFRAINEGARDFMQFTVTATTERASAASTSRLEAVGLPFDLPYTESFANGQVKYDLGILTGTGKWEILTNNEEVSAVDGDNGFIAMNGPTVEANASIWTGKISLENAANPCVSYYVYNFSLDGTPDTNEVEVLVKNYNGTAEWTSVDHITVDETGPLGWNKHVINLSAYKGQVVSIKFDVTSQSRAYTFIDDIRIEDQLAYNFTANEVILPEKARVEKDFNVTVAFTNTGENPLPNYTVTLYRDNEAVATTTGEEVQPGAKVKVTYPQSLDILTDETVSYYATVTSEKDENANDNTTPAKEIQVVRMDLEKVAELSAEQAGTAVNLNWIEPDLTKETVREVTEDFEMAETWAQEVEGWTIIDGDKAYLGGLSGITIPGLSPGATGAFWVFDDSSDELNATFTAYSGHKYLASIYRIDMQKADDWAISPRLEGCAQTVSFYAKAYYTIYTEKIEVLASSTGREIADFTVVMPETVLPGEWTKYSLELPEGTQYFAIRATGESNLLTFIDDATFTPEPDMRGANLLGYNIYRNGVKINESPIEGTGYVDNAADPTSEYVATAVYDRGESAPSNKAAITLGVNETGATTATVRIVNNNIVIENANGMAVAIYTVDGRTIYAAEGNERTSVAVATGIYLVKTGATTVKVVVK